ncbi:MAG: peptidoglycan-binding domain-containing protein [Bryobacteraceae bacterium]
MRWLSAVAWIGIALQPLAAAPAKPKPSSPKPSSAKQSASSKSKPTKAAASAAAHAKPHARSAKQRRVAHVPPPPSYQLQPDPGRYQEIQAALAEKGYFKGDVNGTWSDDSTDALKRFQADKGFSPDGKLSALTLIGLGLGPKHDGSSMTAAAGADTRPNPGSAPPMGDSAPPK